jgi:hypothetical protein
MVRKTSGTVLFDAQDAIDVQRDDLPPAPPQEDDASPPVTQAERRKNAPAAPLFDLTGEGGDR